MPKLDISEIPIDPRITALEAAYQTALEHWIAELGTEEAALHSEQSARRHRVLAQAVPAAILIKPTWSDGKPYEFHCPRCKFWRPFGTMQGAVTHGVGHMLNLHPEEGKG